MTQRDNYFTKILIEEYTCFLDNKNTNTNKEDIIDFISRILKKYREEMLGCSMTDFMRHIDTNRPLDYTNPEEMDHKHKKKLRHRRYNLNP